MFGPIPYKRFENIGVGRYYRGARAIASATAAGRAPCVRMYVRRSSPSPSLCSHKRVGLSMRKNNWKNHFFKMKGDVGMA